MIVAVFIKLESGDDYHFLDKVITPSEVYDKLKEYLPEEDPIGCYDYKTLEALPEEEQEVAHLIRKIFDESWDCDTEI